jgi:hypothetical protein
MVCRAVLWEWKVVLALMKAGMLPLPAAQIYLVQAVLLLWPHASATNQVVKSRCFLEQEQVGADHYL